MINFNKNENEKEYYYNKLNALIDKYGDKIQFKAFLSNESSFIEIYSTNFKTTLEKVKKENKKENKNESSNVKESA